MRAPRSRTTAAVAAAIGALLIAFAPAAAAKQDLRISPPKIELEADAGERTTATINATASGDEAIEVELVHMDFGFDDEHYDLVMISDEAAETTAFSTRGWFSLPKERYRIPAGRSVALTLQIDVPPNQPAGTYLGAALLRVVPPDRATSGGQVQALIQTGPLVFIAVRGGDPPEPRVERFDVPRVQRSGPVRPTLLVGNDGDAFFSVEGTVRFTGRGVDETLDVRRQVVVPGEPRNVRGIEEGRSEAEEAPLRLGTPDLGIGRYTVTARLKVDPIGTTLVAERTVWVVPAWAWVLGALVLAALGAAATSAIRRVRAWRSARRANDLPVDEPEEDEEADHDSFDEASDHEDSDEGSLDALDPDSI